MGGVKREIRDAKQPGVHTGCRVNSRARGCLEKCGLKWAGGGGGGLVEGEEVGSWGE